MEDATNSSTSVDLNYGNVVTLIGMLTLGCFIYCVVVGCVMMRERHRVVFPDDHPDLEKDDDEVQVLEDFYYLTDAIPF